MRSRAAVPLACLVAVLTACGTASDTVAVPDRPASGAPPGGGPDGGPDGGTSGGSWLDDPEADLDAGAPPGGDPESGGSYSNSEVHVDHGGGGEPALVTAVRYASRGAYDRVVVDLKGDAPGYHVTWVDRLVQDGSGKPIDVRGGAYLQLTLFPANAHDDDGRSTWAGGPIYHAGLSNLNQIVRTGDFEGRVGIGLVLDRQAGYQVRERPGRLTVDVAH